VVDFIVAIKGGNNLYDWGEQMKRRVKDASDIPSIVEPLFVGLNARVELLPVMNADDLKKGLSIARQAM